MTTMMTRGTRVIVFTAALLSGTFTFAADPSERRIAGAASDSSGIANVTDGGGNPINLERSAATPNPLGLESAKKASVVQRGQTWWPYATSLPPYTAAPRRVEAMAEDEILVNTTATISVKDAAASLAGAPKDLLLQPGSQLALAEGFYLVKIKGFTRNQEQVDALTRAGAMLGEYLNVNTYVAKIPSSAIRRRSRRCLSSSFVGDYQPAYKISPRIGLEEIPVERNGGRGERPAQAVDVRGHSCTTGSIVNDVLNDLARLCGSTRRNRKTSSRPTR